MARYESSRSSQLRQRLAQEAARIMAEEGVRDFLAAKRKAADRLGIDAHSRHFPTNRQIEEAVAEHHRLFYSRSQPGRLKSLRQVALQAMRLFDCFNPRLVGSVLSGTAPRHADVHLHLFSDPQEQVALFLMEHKIPFDTGERRLRWGSGIIRLYPVYRFLAGEVRIDATVFSTKELREAPLSPVDGRPMKRGTPRELERMLADECDPRPA